MPKAFTSEEKTLISQAIISSIKLIVCVEKVENYAKELDG